MPLILGANSVSGYTVKNSLRFNSGSSDSLTRTTGTPTSQQKFTCSAWCKRTNIGTFNIIQTFYTDANNYLAFDFLTSDRLDVINYAGATTARKITTAVFRDVSAWYHIVASVDTTLATANDRIKIYVNGTLQTAFDFNTAPSQNANLLTNATTTAIGVGEGGSTGYHNGYISEIYYIDGQALDVTSFGETDFDTGIWKPKAYTGTYGTKGYYLQFKNSASLGTDSSGNGNNFTVNNLTSIDQTTDTPTNNFCTFNPLTGYNALANTLLILENGNLTATTSSNFFHALGTIGVTKGKWYWEVKVSGYNTTGTSGSGVINLDLTNQSATPANAGGLSYVYCIDGQKRLNGSISAFGNVIADGDIVQNYLDMDNGKFYVGRNGVLENSANLTSGTGFLIDGLTNTIAPICFDTNSAVTGLTYNANFGNPPYSANSYTDGAGYGNFSYAVPSGYYALNTKNLANFG